MMDDPFTLRGSQGTYRGNGRRNGETQRSAAFNLKAGLVIVEVTHQGPGDFKLEFVTAEEETGADAAPTTTSNTISTAPILLLPLTGVILGRLAYGFVKGFIEGITQQRWAFTEGRGPCELIDIARVRDQEKEALKPGKYRLEAKASNPWTCRFIQPSLGQSSVMLTDQDDDLGQDLTPEGVYVMGPYKAGAKPLLAHAKHTGGGEFLFAAYALDGTHQYGFANEGQFHQESMPTDVRPGKEYILLIAADGEWNVVFTDGY